MADLVSQREEVPFYGEVIQAFGTAFLTVQAIDFTYYPVSRDELESIFLMYLDSAINLYFTTNRTKSGGVSKVVHANEELEYMASRVDQFRKILSIYDLAAEDFDLLVLKDVYLGWKATVPGTLSLTIGGNVISKRELITFIEVKVLPTVIPSPIFEDDREERETCFVTLSRKRRLWT